MIRSTTAPPWRPLLALLAASLDAPAQATWTVTSPTGIQAAIQAASPGDVIVLTASGGFPDYAPFTLDKGVSIRGNGARIGPNAAWPQSTLVVAVPPGEVAHVDQVDFTFGYSSTAIGCPVVVNGGSVRFDRCTLRALPDPMTVHRGEAVLQSSTLTAVPTVFVGRPGLVVHGGHVVLRDVQVDGAAGGCHPQGCGWFGNLLAGTAVVVGNATLHAERCTLRGGGHQTTQFTADGGHGIDATAATIRLVDCAVTGGPSWLGNGGSALVNNGPVVAELVRTTLVPGGPNGSPSIGPIDPAAPLLGLALQPVWTRAQLSTVVLRGGANHPFGLWLTPAPTASATPFVADPVWANSAIPLTFGALDATGQVALGVAVPNLPALQHAPIWCQAVSGITLPLRASTIAGGLVR